MNQDVILTIAQAVLANTKVLQTLVDTLPHEAREAVAAHIEAPKAAPVAPTPVAPVAPLAPIAPVVTPAPVMPAPPTFAAPAPVAPAAPSGAPFTDGKGLIDYVMGAYRAMGAEKGAGIQNVLTVLGYQNINDVKPEHYAQLFAGIEALKG